MAEACFHSGHVEGCYSCLEGQLSRQTKHIMRLRQLLRDSGAHYALKAHDIYWFGRPYDEE